MDNSKLKKKAYKTTLYQGAGKKNFSYKPYVRKQGEIKPYKAYDVNYSAQVNSACKPETKPVVVIKFRKDDLKETRGLTRVYQQLSKFIKGVQDKLRNGLGSILKSWRKD